MSESRKVLALELLLASFIVLFQELAVSLLLVGAPIFFGSICFSRAFAARAAPDRAFGWNILGAVVGGIFEVASMAIGLRALLLVALAAYLMAYLAFRRHAAAEMEPAKSVA